jgi:hypothetical protein
MRNSLHNLGKALREGGLILATVTELHHFGGAVGQKLTMSARKRLFSQCFLCVIYLASSPAAPAICEAKIAALLSFSKTNWRAFKQKSSDRAESDFFEI